MTLRLQSLFAIACTVTLAVSVASAQEPDEMIARPLVEEGAAEEQPEAEPAGFFSDLTEEETKAYAKELRGYVNQMRGVVVEKIAAKIESKQGERLGHISTVLFIISLLGFLLLFMPLLLRRRFPGKDGLLFRYSALAALLFFLAVNLFSAVLLTMRGAQAVTGEYTNPQVRLVDATFDLFEKKAEDIAPVGKSLIEPTLESLREGNDGAALVVLLENVQKIAEDVSVFRSVGNFFSRINFLLGVVPLVLIGLAILFFVQAAKPTLIEIVRIPERAASGQQGVGRQAVRSTLRAVWEETKATLCVIGVILAITIVSGLILAMILMPVIEVFLAYLVVALMYVQSVDQASSFWVLFSLGASIMFLAVTLVVVVIGSAFYLSKVQKIFQRRFREGVPLSAHGRFWKWGTVSLVWSQLLPLIYVKVSLVVIGWIVVKTMETENWALILGGGPAMFLVSFGVCFWACRGVKALAFMAKYKPQDVAAPPPPSSGQYMTPMIGEDDATIPMDRFDPSMFDPPHNPYSAARPAGHSLHNRPVGRVAPPPPPLPGAPAPKQAAAPQPPPRPQGWPFD